MNERKRERVLEKRANDKCRWLSIDLHCTFLLEKQPSEDVKPENDEYGCVHD